LPKIPAPRRSDSAWSEKAGILYVDAQSDQADSGNDASSRSTDGGVTPPSPLSVRRHVFVAAAHAERNAEPPEHQQQRGPGDEQSDRVRQHQRDQGADAGVFHVAAAEHHDQRKYGSRGVMMLVELSPTR
jgi:hypothetical protein